MEYNKNVVVKKNTAKHLAPGGRGWHAVPGEGVLKEADLMETPSAPLQGTSPARGKVNGGFTLIELLVVVLIIGILATVAVPQYQKAVMKSRFIKLYNLAMTYDRVIQEYELANGTYPTSFDALAIDKPSGTIPVNRGSSHFCIQNDEFYCCLIPYSDSNGTSQAINCGDSSYTIAFHYMNKLKQQYCVAKDADSTATKVCNSYGPVISTGWPLFSSNGITYGYTYYRMP